MTTPTRATGASTPMAAQVAATTEACSLRNLPGGDPIARLCRIKTTLALAAFACEAQRVLHDYSDARGFLPKDACEALDALVPARNEWREFDAQLPWALEHVRLDIDGLIGDLAALEGQGGAACST